MIKLMTEKQEVSFKTTAVSFSFSSASRRGAKTMEAMATVNVFNRGKYNLNMMKKYFFNWHSLHASLNSYYEAWSYKEKSGK